MTLRSRPGSSRRNDEGRIALLALVLAFAVLMMIGLSVDGGGKIRAMERADNVASEAARAAAQAILAPQAIEGGEKVVDPAAAVAAAQNYLAAAGVTGVVDIAPDRKHITVTVTITYTTLFLGLIGINTLTSTGHATTVLVAT
ncbi:pilus assembly protein TadG-related protein [Dactylosporangium sp. CA-233914]|uniref:pilus assembly protein TadG-related protein n=1 Tax=Dactylosporangium sp. CA-233914 TaxID=3239934 RepID=UPI003D8CAF8C